MKSYVSYMFSIPKSRIPAYHNGGQQLRELVKDLE